MDSVDVDGLRIAFTKAGRGRLVVLLGGFVGDGFVTWRRQIEALSTSYTVVAWDAPGSGASSDVPESFRLPDYADCLAGLVSALMLEQPVIVGLSFGGALALEFFRRHGAQVRALFLAGAYAGWAGSLSADTVEQRLRTSLAASRMAPAAFVSLLLPSMFSTSAPADLVAEFGANMAERFAPRDSARWRLPRQRPIYVEYCPRSTCPRSFSTVRPMSGHRSMLPKPSAPRSQPRAW